MMVPMLSVSMALAVACHYYGVIAIWSFAVAEFPGPFARIEAAGAFGSLCC